MVYIDHLRNITMTPQSMNWRQESFGNLSGSFEQSIDTCLKENRLYKNRGRICYQKLINCAGTHSPQDRQRIANFCGEFGTSGFYHNGAYWVRH